jgi:hypothetical protein
MKYFLLSIFVFTQLTYALDSQKSDDHKFKVTFNIQVEDIYGVKIKKYNLKGLLFYNRLQKTCYLDFGMVVNDYLKSRLECLVMNEKEEFFVAKDEVFKLIEEMTVLKFKKGDHLKRLIGVFKKLKNKGLNILVSGEKIQSSLFKFKNKEKTMKIEYYLVNSKERLLLELDVR